MAGRYWLGVDIGTTYTAAAVRRDGRTDVVHLGTRGAAIPSVLLLRSDGELLTGDTAKRRAVSEPDRVAAEFKRRVGDPVPVLVGGSPFAAEALVARLLKWVIETVTQREGGAPEGVAVTHPANWGPYKLDLLANAIRTAGLGRVTFLSEPAAAARHYATLARVPDGATVAVYDLGGGTFDACVLRKEVDGSFSLLGHPEGIERLGGIDLDEAVFGHVQRAVPDAFGALDADDPATRSALAHLRDECMAAKEQLSSDVDASIAVMLPGQAGRDVRITRTEFEGLVRPVLADTIGCVERSLASAGVTAADLHAVLLVGGSSRVPLVAQLVEQGLGRPVAVDADPKLAVAQGAALAAEAAFASPAVVAPAETPTVVAPVVPVVELEPEPVPEPEPIVDSPAAAVAAPPSWPSGGGSTPPPSELPEPERVVVATGRGKAPLIIAAVVLVAAAVGGFLLLGGGDGGGQDDLASDQTTTTTTAAAAETTTTVAETLEGGAEFAGVDFDLPQFVDISEVLVEDDGHLKIVFTTTFDVAPANLEGPNNHIHFFYDNVNREATGMNGVPEPCICWLAFGGGSPVRDDTFTVDTKEGHSEICAVVATPQHDIADVDGDGEPDPGSGDCIDITPLLDGADSVEETLGRPVDLGDIELATATPTTYACEIA